MLTKLRNRKQARDFDPFREPTQEDAEEEQRHQVIDDAIERRTKELLRAQHGGPIAERLSKQECRVQAEEDVYGAIRREELREQTRRIRADLASAYTRNKHLFSPWFAGVGYAGAGEIASVLADTDVLTGAGPGVAAAVGAAATSWGVWQRIKQLPTKYLRRFRVGAFAGGATCMALPLAPWEWHGGILFGGVAALVAASVKYWRDNAPSYPPMGGYDEQPVSVEQAVHTVSPPESDIPEEAADIIDDWNQYVAGTKILPAATLERPQRFDHGWIFTVKLVRGQQKFDTLQKATSDIAAALNQPPSAIHPDPNPDPYKPLQPTLTITTRRPDITYTGPVIVREGGSVFIELGPYTDGRGTVRYEILSDQLTDEELAKGAKPRGSAVGGFILGDKGSGKTRLQESIALGAMELGVEVWYLDPQGGASAPTLRDNAAWSLMGLESPDGTKEFGNVEDLAAALEGVLAVRQDENAALGYTGFQHTRQRPMILVIIDECHRVFEQYGKRFGDIDRLARKTGIAMLGASQAPSQEVFGGSITLRNGMAGANGYVLKYNGSNARLAFGGLDDEITRGCGRLRPNRTLGYAVNSARPHAVFQNRYTPELEPFFTQIKPSTLDQLATIGAGEAYAKRHETAQQNIATVQARLEGYRNGTLKPGKQPKNNNTDGRTATSGGSSGTNVYWFPGRQPKQRDTEVTWQSLTGRQAQILEQLADAACTAKDLAVQLGVSDRTVRTDLRFLKERKFVRVVDETEGRYTASSNV